MSYAGFWLRFLASLIDGIVFGLICSVVSAFFIGFSSSSGLSEETITSYVSLILPWLYYAIEESSERQATIGKRAMGIKVTNLSGNRVTFIKASVRYFATYLSVLSFFIGFLMAAFTKRKQALHDLIPKTLVVKV